MTKQESAETKEPVVKEIGLERKYKPTAEVNQIFWDADLKGRGDAWTKTEKHIDCSVQLLLHHHNSHTPIEKERAKRAIYALEMGLFFDTGNPIRPHKELDPWK